MIGRVVVRIGTGMKIKRSFEKVMVMVGGSERDVVVIEL